MKSQEKLGPLEITCDAPPYPIVQASSRLGFQDPEDVRWCRLGHLVAETSAWRLSRTRAAACLCGQGLPDLIHCTFTYSTGTEESYVLGQCVRCRTVLWDEP